MSGIPHLPILPLQCSEASVRKKSLEHFEACSVRFENSVLTELASADIGRLGSDGDKIRSSGNRSPRRHIGVQRASI